MRHIPSKAQEKRILGHGEPHTLVYWPAQLGPPPCGGREILTSESDGRRFMGSDFKEIRPTGFDLRKST